MVIPLGEKHAQTRASKTTGLKDEERELEPELRQRGEAAFGHATGNKVSDHGSVRKITQLHGHPLRDIGV